MHVQRLGVLVCLIAAIAMAGCGGGSKGSTKSTTTTTTANSPAASPVAGAGSSGAMNSTSGRPLGAVAPVPASLHCGAVAPVWVNSRSHVYHEPSDPLYGRTRHGQYMCPSQATAAGYHAAKAGMYGRHRRHGGGAMAPASPAAAPASP